MANNPIIDKLILTHKIMFEKAGVDPGKFLSDNFGEKSLACHKQILETLSKLCPTREDREELQHHNYVYLNERFEEDKNCVNDVDYQVSRVFHDYMDKFYGKFFTIEDGEIKFTHVEDCNLPSLAKDRPRTSKAERCKEDYDYIMEKMKSKNFKHEVEFIVAEDGKVYFAPNSHRTLAGWLNANGIDLHNAIRVEATKKSIGESSFNFTSLFNYAFSNSSDEDRLITITDDQAKGLGRIYEALASEWSNMKPFEESIRYSTGFSIGMKDLDAESPLFAGNLNTLSHNVDFNRGEYIKSINFNSDIHAPLTE